MENRVMPSIRERFDGVVRVVANPGPDASRLSSGQAVAGCLPVHLPDGQELFLALDESWGELLEYVWPGAQLGLLYVETADGGRQTADGEADNGQTADEINHSLIYATRRAPHAVLLATRHSYVVLEPHILVSPSAIREMEGCPRKYYTRKRQGSSPASYEVIRGIAINEAFDLLLERPPRPASEILDTVLSANTLALACLPDSKIPLPAVFRAEVKRHLGVLSQWVKDGLVPSPEERTLEPTLLSPKYGLAGRLDLLLAPGPQARTYELKTGRPPRGAPWPGDRTQVACYQLLLESAFGCRNPDSFLLYSGDEDQPERPCSVAYENRRHVIRIRNRMVALDYALTLSEGERIANPAARAIPRVEAGDCANCPPFVKNPCLSTCRVLQEKRCDTCSQILFCSGSESKPDRDLEYYHSYFRLVEMERAHSRSEFARNWLQPHAVLQEGKAVADLRYERILGRQVTFRFAQPNHSGLRPGDLVLLYPGNLAQGEVFKAAVAAIDRDSVTLVLKKTVPPETWRDRDWALCADSMETSFDSTQAALYRWLRNPDSHQRDLVLGRTRPRFAGTPLPDLASLPLNSAQHHAVGRALQATDYLLIQGPPGTGKTHTLAQLIGQLVRRGDRVLLCAFTHRAVDNVLIKLRDSGYADFVRLGAAGAVDPSLHDRLLEECLRPASLDDLPRLQEALRSVRVIACTSVAAVTHPLVQKLSFDTAVVDEASQLTEPGTLAAIGRAQRFILVGDHQQLPSVVQSEAARTGGLAQSLFERLIELNGGGSDVLVTLREQYRMHRDLMALSNERFYGGRLQAHPDNALATLRLDPARLPAELRPWMDPTVPLVFLDVLPDGGDTGEAEAELCSALVAALVKADIDPADIGIITPFRAQVAEILRRIAGHVPGGSLIVDTVDRFQGNDRTVILFSCAVSDTRLLDDFVGEARRLNVTLTRAQKKLIVMGQGRLLQRHPLFADLLRRAKVYPVDYSALRT